MADWQPIETAPKDGTWVCIGWKDPGDAEMQEWFTMRWDASATNDMFNPGVVGMWANSEMTWKSGEFGPTHWKPVKEVMH